jgi:hypothetical protein
MTKEEYSVYLMALSNAAVARKLLQDKIVRQRAKGVESKSWQYEKDRIDSLEDQLSSQVIKHASYATTEEDKKMSILRKEGWLWSAAKLTMALSPRISVTIMSRQLL